MQLQCTIQEREVWIRDETDAVEVQLETWKGE
jgi:uncharacterized protein YaeQ